MNLINVVTRHLKSQLVLDIRQLKDMLFTMIRAGLVTNFTLQPQLHQISQPAFLQRTILGERALDPWRAVVMAVDCHAEEHNA